MRRSLLACLATALVALPPAATARAEVVGGALGDRLEDSTGGPGTDIERASWTFDGDAGRLSVAVTFGAKSTSADWGVVNASARSPATAVCEGAEWARLRGSTLSDEASASVGTAADGPQPDGSVGPTIVPASGTRSEDGRTKTIEVTHERLVGRSAACVAITISHNGVLDTLAIPRDSTEAAGPPPGTPDPNQPDGRPDPAAVRLASSSRLRFRRGAARVTIAGVAAGMTGRLWLVLNRVTVIGSGRYSAASDDPIRVRLTLNRRGRRHLRRHPSFRAALGIVSTFETETTERRFAVRVKRQ